MLTKMGLPKLKWTLLTKSEVDTGEKRLTFSGVEGLFPNFPVSIRYRAIPNSSKISVAQMITKFAATNIVKVYSDLFDELDDFGKPVCLLVSWAGLKNGMVWHNWGAPASGCAFTAVFSEETLYGEPFSQFMTRLESWRPEDC